MIKRCSSEARPSSRARFDGVAVDPSTHEVFVSTGDITGGTSHAAAIITPDFPNPPGAPTIGAASAGNGKATVAFSPPVSDGGQNISSYIAIATDVTNPSRGGQTASRTTSPITIAGLTNGDTYTFTVTAANYAPGLPSESSPAVVPLGVWVLVIGCSTWNEVERPLHPADVHRIDPRQR